MRRPMRKIAQMIVVFCLMVLTLSACSSGDEEIFNNADLKTEMETDNEEDKKEKPGSNNGSS